MRITDGRIAVACAVVAAVVYVAFGWGEGTGDDYYGRLRAGLRLPFLATGSTAIAQGLAAQIAGGASAGPLYLGLRAFGAPRWVALAGIVLSALGTTLLFTRVDGRS